MDEDLENAKAEYADMIAKMKDLYADVEGQVEVVKAASKPWYVSKTIWVNAIALAGVGVMYYTGTPISAEEGVGILAVVNLFLRVFTGKKLG